MWTTSDAGGHLLRGKVTADIRNRSEARPGNQILSAPPVEEDRDESDERARAAKSPSDRMLFKGSDRIISW